MRVNEILKNFSLQGITSGILSGLIVYYFVSNSGDAIFELSPVSFVAFLSFPIVYFLLLNDMIEVLPKDRWLFVKSVIFCVSFSLISFSFLLLFYTTLGYLDRMFGLQFTDDASFFAFVYVHLIIICVVYWLVIRYVRRKEEKKRFLGAEEVVNSECKKVVYSVKDEDKVICNEYDVEIEIHGE